MDLDSSQEIPLLTYNSLYNLLRGEKISKSLQELPSLFYEASENFFEAKKNELKRVKDMNDLDKLAKEKLLFSNSEKILKELFAIRCNKISKIAIENQLFGDDILSESNILDIEQNFLNSIQDAIKKIKIFKKSK